MKELRVNLLEQVLHQDQQLGTSGVKEETMKTGTTEATLMLRFNRTAMKMKQVILQVWAGAVAQGMKQTKITAGRRTATQLTNKANGAKELNKVGILQGPKEIL